MEKPTDEQVQKMLSDLSSVKEAVQKNTSLIRNMELQRPFCILCFAGGAAIIIASLVFYALERRFGGWAAVPGAAKAGLSLLLGLTIIALGIFKGTFFLRQARRVDARVSFLTMAKEYYGLRVYQIMIPLFLLLVFLVGYVFFHHYYGLIIPMLSAGFGLMLVNLGVTVRFREFMFGGYWMIIAGGVLLVMEPLPAFLGVALSIGLGYVVLGIAFAFGRGKKGEG